MGKNRMKLWFDEEEDILYVSFGQGPSVDSEEKEEGVRVEYNKRGDVVGIEITNITRRLIKPLVRRLNSVVKI